MASPSSSTPHTCTHPTRKSVNGKLPKCCGRCRSDLRANRSLLLIGDLNHTPDVEEYKLWQQGGLLDTFAQVGKGVGTTFIADGLDRRIDYVWAAGPIAKQVVDAKPLFQGAFRTNPADPQTFSLSDHLPQMAVFEME